jgi:hypothetical protein
VGDESNEIDGPELAAHLKAAVASVSSSDDPDFHVVLARSSSIMPPNSGLLYNIVDAPAHLGPFIDRLLQRYSDVFAADQGRTGVCLFQRNNVECDEVASHHGFNTRHLSERRRLFAKNRARIDIWVGTFLTHESGGALRELREIDPTLAVR